MFNYIGKTDTSQLMIYDTYDFSLDFCTKSEVVHFIKDLNIFN